MGTHHFFISAAGMNSDFITNQRILESVLEDVTLGQPDYGFWVAVLVSLNVLMHCITHVEKHLNWKQFIELIVKNVDEVQQCVLIQIRINVLAYVWNYWNPKIYKMAVMCC